MYKGRYTYVIDSVLDVSNPLAKAFIKRLALDREAHNGSTFTVDYSLLEEYLEDYPEHKEAIVALQNFLKEKGLQELDIYYWW